jgi:hypothetical protein
MIVATGHPANLAREKDDRAGGAKPPLTTDVRFKASSGQSERDSLEGVAARGVAIKAGPEPLNASHRDIRDDRLTSASRGRRLERDGVTLRRHCPELYANRQLQQFGELRQRDGLPAEHAPRTAVEQGLREAVAGLGGRKRYRVRVFGGCIRGTGLGHQGERILELLIPLTVGDRRILRGKVIGTGQRRPLPPRIQHVPGASASSHRRDQAMPC